MAQRVTEYLVDDLDGESDAAETVEFGLDGITYEVDLNDEHAGDLRGELEAYIAVARRVGGRAKRGTAKPGSTVSAAVDREQNRAIRTWANENGYELAERGRIPAHVVEAYNAKAGRNGLVAAS